MPFNVIRKQIVELNEDFCEIEDCCSKTIEFYLKGTEGIIIDFNTLKLIPNLSKEIRAEIMDREICAKERNDVLVIIRGKIISVPVRLLDYVRVEPGPIFHSKEEFIKCMNKLKDIR